MSNYEFWDELGKIFHAVVAYQEKSVEFNKRFINPWIRLGNVFDKQDRNTEAVAAYQKAIELDPENAQNWFDLGNAYFRMDASQDAADAYNKALELDPGFGWAYNNLALTLAKGGSYAESIPLYQRSIDLLEEDKDKAVAWNRLGNAYRKLNEYESALDAFQKADELDEENAGFRDQLDDVPDGPTLIEGENNDDPSPEVQSPGSAAPAGDEPVMEVADQQDNGQAAATQSSDSSIEPVAAEVPADPSNPDSLGVGLSDGLNAAGQDIESTPEVAATDASIEISAVPEQAGPDQDAVALVAVADAGQSESENSDPASGDTLGVSQEAEIEADAPEELEVAEVKEATITIIVQNIVETYTDSQAGAEAVTQTSDVEIDATPAEPDPALEQPAASDGDPRASAMQTDSEAATPDPEIEVGANPEDAGQCTVAGTEVLENDNQAPSPDVLAAEDEAGSIHGAYEEYLKDNGDDLHILVSESLEIDAETQASVASEEPVTKIDASGEVQIEVDTKNARVWNELGNVYFNTGAFDDALSAYSKAIELDRLFAWPYSNLALTYVQKGRFVEAILLYQRSIELFSTDPDKAVSWNRLGNVYRRLNDYENAIAAYQQADELDPDNTTLSMQSRFSLLGNYATDSKPSYAA